MVARGDLGIEVPYEELPIIQRRAINLCLAAVKPVIVATHLLESMITNPAPTRAEITDIANAVFEHADAIMLSGETTTGKYPMECVEIMDRIARRIEQGKTVATYVNPVIPILARERISTPTAVYLANETKRGGHLRLYALGQDGALHRRPAPAERADLRLHAEPGRLPQPVAPFRRARARDRVPQRPERESAADAGAAARARVHASGRLDRRRLRSRGRTRKSLHAIHVHTLK